MEENHKCVLASAALNMLHHFIIPKYEDGGYNESHDGSVIESIVVEYSAISLY
jgi:hypothetical protein